MSIKRMSSNGSATIEYALMLLVVFAFVVAAIVMMMILYQRTFIQDLAEDAAQSLARQWNYQPLPVEGMESGVYKRQTYDDREIYWNLKLWNNAVKEERAEKYIKEMVAGTGLLKESVSDSHHEKMVEVNYAIGIPATLTVDIRVAYRVPGAGILKLLGFGDHIILEGHGKASVYDPKDMINTTDYVLQLIRSTKIYQDFAAKISPLKEKLDKLFKD